MNGKLLRGNEGAFLTNFAALDQADSSCVSFFGNAKYKDQLASTAAGLVLVSTSEVEVPETAALVLVENPIMAFDVIVKAFGVRPPEFVSGVHEDASVAPDAKLDVSKVSILPNATVLSGASIGNGSRIGPGAVVGENASIGEGCEIGPNVTIREGCLIGDRVILHAGVVVGGDGFGFEFIDGRHQKVEQLGIVCAHKELAGGCACLLLRRLIRLGEGARHLARAFAFDELADDLLLKLVCRRGAVRC